MLTRRRTPQTQPYITQLTVGQKNVNKIKEKNVCAAVILLWCCALKVSIVHRDTFDWLRSVS